MAEICEADAEGDGHVLIFSGREPARCQPRLVQQHIHAVAGVGVEVACAHARDADGGKRK